MTYDINANKKLEDGLNILAQANNNPYILGTALQTIHGALEDACRLWLSQPHISKQHNINVQSRSDTNWQTLLELMPKYYQWNDRDVQYVRRMNGIRNNVAHGDGFKGTQQEVEQYAAYVKNIFNRNGQYATSTPNNYQYQNETNDTYPQTISSGALNCPNCGSYKIERTGIWKIILTISKSIAYFRTGTNAFTSGVALSIVTHTNPIVLLLSLIVTIVASAIFIVIEAIFWLIPFFVAYKKAPVTAFRCSRCAHRWKQPSSIFRSLISSLIKTAIALLLLGMFFGFIIRTLTS